MTHGCVLIVVGELHPELLGSEEPEPSDEHNVLASTCVFIGAFGRLVLFSS